MTHGRKISLIYSAIALAIILMVASCFYLLFSRHAEQLYYDYLDDKAYVVAEERFERDEVDSDHFGSIVSMRQNSIPTSNEEFINLQNADSAHKQLSKYITEEQIAKIEEGAYVHFRQSDEVGTVFVYDDNEGRFAVVLRSRNPYGEELGRGMGW